MSAPATLACDRCGAALTFDGVRTATCPFCGSASFLPHRLAEDRVEPRFAVAFTSDAAEAHRHVRRWLGARRIFTDRALRTARVEELRGVYVPAYMYSAVARTTYTAQIGERWSETIEVPAGSRDDDESISIGPPVEPIRPGFPFRPGPIRRPRKPRGTGSGPATEYKTVVRTEYRALRGRHLTYVTDVLVGASAGLARHEFTRLLPYDYRALRRFSPALVVGFVQEEYSLAAAACEQASRAAAADEVSSRLRRFLPGDSYSDLEHRTTTQWESLDPVLVPVWIMGVRYRADRPPLRVLVNGQTNAVVGRPPLVWWKVLIAFLALAAVVALVIGLVRGDLP